MNNNEKALAKANEIYRKRLKDNLAKIHSKPELMDKSNYGLRVELGIGPDTVKRIRYIVETGCTIEEAVAKFSADKERQALYDKKAKERRKSQDDYLDAKMHRPNGVNYLSVAWV